MVAPLGSLSPQVFLEKFWQKSPVVIRQAIPQFDLQFHKNELAGLACEEGVDTRIVTGDGGIVHPWQVVEGPFKPEIFSRLPQKLWTLLVREVELQVDEIWNLRQMFRFLPDWRVDDVMVSYAEEGGSVGPHIDYYDVFLLQGMGTRKWLIESQPRPNAELVPDLSLKILKDFQPDREYVLSPGDILYLPPGYAHHGVALGECMTLSVGCRAPSHREILSHSELSLPPKMSRSDTKIQIFRLEIIRPVSTKKQLGISGS